MLSTDFVHAHLPSLHFSGVYDLNGIKNGAPVTATLSEELIIGIGDQSFRWRALKADITDHCILVWILLLSFSWILSYWRLL